jgi:two-component system, OmpR family, response regulator VicR
MKVLVIEDDKDIVDTITLAFQVGWPDVELVSTGEGGKGVELVERESPDFVILDLGLPDINGFEVLRRVRSFSDVPVIILTVMTDEDDIIRGLEWGADDYVTKPFRKMELLARIKTILRRQKPGRESTMLCGTLRYEPSNRRFYNLDKEVPLTSTESEILYALMKQAGQVLSHSALAENVWGDDYPGAADTIKVHIRHLREKIENDPSHPKLIVTRPGIGYSLEIPQ